MFNTFKNTYNIIRDELKSESHVCAMKIVPVRNGSSCSGATCGNIFNILNAEFGARVKGEIVPYKT